jgi:DNA-binding NarL/FixJ family response regulator
MRILLVDDHVLFRQGLACLLVDYPDLQVVGQAGTVREAIAKAEERCPDLILMDLNLPDGAGLDAMNAIMSARPEAKVVVMALDENDEHLLTAKSSGAAGTVLKNMPLHQVVESLRSAGWNSAALGKAAASPIVDELSYLKSLFYFDEAGLRRLTGREKEVLRLIGEERSNQEIAMVLDITENTVKVHIHKIYEKLRLRNRREAGRFARYTGLFSSYPIFP